MFYPIVYFLSPAAVAAGAKVALVGGKYLTTVPTGIGIQAMNGAVPPADQSAEVAALTADVARLQAIVDALPPPPTPPDLTPVPITQVQIDALKADAAKLRADLAAL